MAEDAAARDIVRIKEGMTSIVDNIEAARTEAVEEFASPRLGPVQRANSHIRAAGEHFLDPLALVFRSNQIFGGIDHEQHVEAGCLHPLVAPFRH